MLTEYSIIEMYVFMYIYYICIINNLTKLGKTLDLVQQNGA